MEADIVEHFQLVDEGEDIDCLDIDSLAIMGRISGHSKSGCKCLANVGKSSVLVEVGCGCLPLNLALLMYS
jgi:hypothetical protein